MADKTKKKPDCKGSVFANRMKELRSSCKISQYGLSKIVGISQPAICHYEHGSTFPTAKSLVKLSSTFECTIDYMIGLVEHPSITYGDAALQLIDYAHFNDCKFFFGKMLKAQRNAHGLSQNKLAEQIGVKQSNVSAYEKGDAFPSMDNLYAICKILSISADYLLGRAVIADISEREIVP